jgi:hypothetical protein
VKLDKLLVAYHRIVRIMYCCCYLCGLVRVLHIAESHFEEPLIGQRRDAVCGLTPELKV